MSDPKFGSAPESLLGQPLRVAAELEKEAKSGDLDPSTVAALPRYLRTFFRRFLVEELDIRIEHFSEEERRQISDLLVDLEADKEEEATWPLLSDFIDLCDSFADYGLMSVPEAAEEHERSILEMTEQVLENLADWGAGSGNQPLEKVARGLAGRIGALNARTDLAG